MATYIFRHPSTRTNGQCTRRFCDVQMFGGPSTLDCTHHARWSRRGRTHYPVRGLRWPRTSMATPVRARMASARCAVGMHKCWGDPRHWFAPTTRAGRVVDARTTRCVDFYGQLRLWRPQYAHEWPVRAARLGCTIAGGTPDTDLHPPLPLVASWTHALRGAWTSLATCFHGRPSTHTNGQCTRRGCDVHMFGGPSTLVRTPQERWPRRGRTHYPVCGLLWPYTSMTTPVCALMASARGAFVIYKCSADHPP